MIINVIKRINSYFFGEEFTIGDVVFYWGSMAIMLLIAGTTLAIVA